MPTAIKLENGKNYAVNEESCTFMGTGQMTGLGTVYIFRKRGSAQQVVVVQHELNKVVRPLRKFAHQFKLDDDRKTIKYGNARFKNKRKLYDYAVQQLKLEREEVWRIMQQQQTSQGIIDALNQILKP